MNVTISDFPTEKQESLGPSTKRPRLDASEVKAMSAKQYMDELIVPILLKGLSVCNKQVPNTVYDAPRTPSPHFYLWALDFTLNNYY